jgi:hypothetical protein
MSIEACLDLVEHAFSNPAYVARKEHEIGRSFVPHTWRQTAQQISRIVDGVLSHAQGAASNVR